MKKQISVILCTYNRAGDLQKALESLLHQEVSQDFEFEAMVVDNNSTDGTRAVIESWIGPFGGRLKYLFQPRQGKCLSMNMAIGQARGDILVFTDDDVILDPRWLLNIYECFKKYDCDALGGRVLPTYLPQTPQWVKDNAVKLSGSVVIYDYGEQTMEFDRKMYNFIGANYAFKKEVFAECGFFSPDFGPGTPIMGEDMEFIDRIKDEKKLYYCGAALVWHPFDPQRLALKHVARWNVQLGRYAARNELGQKDQKVTYCFGIPRYLYKGVVIDFLRICLSVLSVTAFYDAWRSFFRKVGMIREYRSLGKRS